MQINSLNRTNFGAKINFRDELKEFDRSIKARRDRHLFNKYLIAIKESPKVDEVSILKNNFGHYFFTSRTGETFEALFEIPKMPFTLKDLKKLAKLLRP